MYIAALFSHQYLPPPCVNFFSTPPRFLEKEKTLRRASSSVGTVAAAPTRIAEDGTALEDTASKTKQALVVAGDDEPRYSRNSGTISAINSTSRISNKVEQPESRLPSIARSTVASESNTLINDAGATVRSSSSRRAAAAGNNSDGNLVPPRGPPAAMLRSTGVASRDVRAGGRSSDEIEDKISGGDEDDNVDFDVEGLEELTV